MRNTHRRYNTRYTPTPVTVKALPELIEAFMDYRGGLKAKLEAKEGDVDIEETCSMLTAYADLLGTITPGTPPEIAEQARRCSFEAVTSVVPFIQRHIEPKSQFDNVIYNFERMLLSNAPTAPDGEPVMDAALKYLRDDAPKYPAFAEAILPILAARTGGQHPARDGMRRLLPVWLKSIEDDEKRLAMCLTLTWQAGSDGNENMREFAQWQMSETLNQFKRRGKSGAGFIDELRFTHRRGGPQPVHPDTLAILAWMQREIEGHEPEPRSPREAFDDARKAAATRCRRALTAIKPADFNFGRIRKAFFPLRKPEATAL